MQTKLEKKTDLCTSIDHFIFKWDNFPLDYWWRTKYKIPFGSPQHRSISFFDILFEYREEINVRISRIRKKQEEERVENKSLGIYKDKDKEIVHLTKHQIDSDYEDLDLSQFDRK